mmetsp:Transcript_21551/g.43610  ORF Transcript_21551/g.43610 Transcript_21551/m.43610 type:complete len:321 (+) Transcript_21551:146-1108(+)
MFDFDFDELDEQEMAVAKSPPSTARGAAITVRGLAGDTVAVLHAPPDAAVEQLRMEIAGRMGCRSSRLQLLRAETILEDRRSLSHYTSAPAVQVTALVVGLPPPSHAWDFRACPVDVPDETSTGDSSTAHLERDASSKGEGVELRRPAYIRLDPWSFGGAITVEMRLLVADSRHGYVLTFKDGPPHNDPRRFFSLHVNKFRFLIGCRREYDVVDLEAQQVPLRTFFHVTLTYSRSVMQVFINGVRVGYKDGCPHADTAMTEALRGTHWLGRSHHDDPEVDHFKHSFSGTISFLRIYHGRVLDLEDVAELSSRSQGIAGSP